MKQKKGGVVDLRTTAKSAQAEKDQYYERTAYETLERVAEQNKGKSKAELVKAWKQSYPFGTDRKGRKYKIWNRAFNVAKKAFDEGLIKYDGE